MDVRNHHQQADLKNRAAYRDLKAFLVSCDIETVPRAYKAWLRPISWRRRHVQMPSGSTSSSRVHGGRKSGSTPVLYSNCRHSRADPVSRPHFEWSITVAKAWFHKLESSWRGKIDLHLLQQVRQVFTNTLTAMHCTACLDSTSMGLSQARSKPETRPLCVLGL